MPTVHSLSHITFIYRDLEKTTHLFKEILHYYDGGHIFSADPNIRDQFNNDVAEFYLNG